jgi:hypothetical protein
MFHGYQFGCIISPLESFSDAINRTPSSSRQSWLGACHGIQIKNGICALRARRLTACGGRAKIPPQAVKPLSVGHRFSFSFFVFNFSFLI